MYDRDKGIDLYIINIRGFIFNILIIWIIMYLVILFLKYDFIFRKKNLVYCLNVWI